MGLKARIAWGCVAVALGAITTTSCRQTDGFYSNVLRSDIFYQVYSVSKYDFLWVFDNSGSMASRRAYVRDNMNQFVSILERRKAADYQMAVVTTDVFSQNGDLVAAPNGVDVVKSVTSADPIGDFAAIVNNITDTGTSFWEQGLEASYQAVLKHRAKFSREGVPLLIVYVTDEDDFSCAANCTGVEPEHNVNWIPHGLKRYVEFFQQVKKGEETDVFIFPIVITEGQSCSFASIGIRYMKLAEEMGGVSRSGSVCDSKLSESYQKVAEVIANRGSRFKLSVKSKGHGLRVFVNDELVPFSPDNYVFEEEANELVFTGTVPEKGSKIELVYNEDVN